MRAVDVIVKKRNGSALSRDEIRFFVEGVTAGTLPDYQASALLMAILLRGMTTEETAWLTDAMVHSGIRVDLSEIPGIKVDKHSTGGVGDKTSLILAPLAAACGVYVPMISGRGLGHTGGTLDKLESIPGFDVRLSLEQLRRVLRGCGLGLIGQTPKIAPADRKLYALRDVTATVESLPLISASIMSKKMAEGIDALVLDVKRGDGAFLRSREEAKALAQTMLDIGKGMGKKVAALLTDMEQPLGRSVGNALEVAECVETLKGRGPKDLESLSVELAAWMVHLAGLSPTLDPARARVRSALASGAGLERFRRVVELQGGNPRVCDDLSLLPQARETVVVRAERDGRVTRLAGRAIGHAAMLLGAGRETVNGAIDPAVGFVFHKKVGDPVAVGEPIVSVCVGSPARREAAIARLREAIVVGPEAKVRGPLVLDLLT